MTNLAHQPGRLHAPSPRGLYSDLIEKVFRSLLVDGVYASGGRENPSQISDLLDPGRFVLKPCVFVN